MIFDISINEFNRKFQLYQKGERYNLNLHDLDYSSFLLVFFEELIEDFEISFSNNELNKIKKESLIKTTLSHYFEDVDYFKSIEIISIQGYFTSLDLYFNCANNLIEINYIKRDILFQFVDRLLNDLECNYKSRLKTELLLNMEFD